MSPSPLRGCEGPLYRTCDTLLLDLDGVLYLGGEPVDHAADALAAARAAGVAAAFVTNNASRTPAQIADQLVALGIAAEAEDIVTSSMAVARILREHFPDGGMTVLVCGGVGLREEVGAAGFRVVASADDAPDAVALGFDRELTWARLAEASLAVHRGALWVAANRDATLPSPRGPLPGTGSLVAMLVTATGREPLVAGKPEPALHAEAVRRSGSHRPLVVGDRLDTDIAGAQRAGTASLLVLTGVDGLEELLRAGPEERPTYLAADLRGLLDAHPPADHGRCRRWQASVRDGRLSVHHNGADVHTAGQVRPDGTTGPDDGLDRARAVLSAVWSERDRGGPDLGLDLARELLAEGAR